MFTKFFSGFLRNIDDLPVEAERKSARGIECLVICSTAALRLFAWPHWLPSRSRPSRWPPCRPPRRPPRAEPPPPRPQPARCSRSMATSAPSTATCSPFYGNLRPFYGNLRPFYGNLRPFWGNLRPFWGDTGAFYGDLKSFWGVSTTRSWARARRHYRQGRRVLDRRRRQLGPDLHRLERRRRGRRQRGQLPGHRRPAEGHGRQLAHLLGRVGPGQDRQELRRRLRQRRCWPKYGINLNDPTSLAKLDETDRAMFFLEWYDGLMNFSGTDHVDHWMKTVNWTPSLTDDPGHRQGRPSSASSTRRRSGDVTLQKSSRPVRTASRTSPTATAPAVASLMVGAHDGKGVMGMAPNATVSPTTPSTPPARPTGPTSPPACRG